MNKKQTQNTIEEIENQVDRAPIHMKNDFRTKLDNYRAGRDICDRCDGTGNELYSMYRRCFICRGKGYLEGYERDRLNSVLESYTPNTKVQEQIDLAEERGYWEARKDEQKKCEEYLDGFLVRFMSKWVETNGFAYGETTLQDLAGQYKTQKREEVQG